MRVMVYALSVIIFWGVYLLGKLIASRSTGWADRLESRYTSHITLEKMFSFSGWIIQAVAVVWGFLDVVAVLVLAT